MALNNMFNLLRWFFTPIKLYSGDGDGGGSSSSSSYDRAVQAAQDRYESTVAGITGATAQQMEDRGYSGRVGVGRGGAVGLSEWARTMDAIDAQFSAMNKAYQQQSTFGVSGDFGYSIGSPGSNPLNNLEYTKTTEQLAVEEAMTKYGGPVGSDLNMFNDYYTPSTDIFDDISDLFSELKNGVNNISQDMQNVFTREKFGYLDTQVAPYKANSGAYAYYETTKGLFGNLSHTTTLVTPNILGGYDVMIAEKGGLTEFGNQIDNYTTDRTGSIEKHTTETKLGNGMSFTSDTHYWKGNNTEFGFAAEMVTDLAEILGAKTSTARALGAAAEIGMLFFNVLMPSVQMLSAGTKLYGLSKAYGLISMGIGAIGIYATLDELNKFGSEFDLGYQDQSLSPLSGGDGYNSDLKASTVKELFNEEFGPILVGTNGMNAAQAMMPKVNRPTQYIKPKYNEENNMQSQQAVFIDYRGGLSEVLASNLIGANEGSLYENISIDKGTMESIKLGNPIASKENTYYRYLPDGSYFHSPYPFSYTELGNFAYLTVDDGSLPGIYQLDYNSIAGNSTTTDLVQVQLIAPTTEPDVNAVGSTELDKEIWEEYIYAYTYYDEDTGFESAPKFSTTFLKKTEQLDVTNISYSTEANVDKIRLYRLGGYSTTYRLVTEINNSVNTGTTSYRDSLSEEYNPTVLDTQNLVIVENLKNLTEHKGTMFGYKDNRVYFSRPGKPNVWSEFSSVRVSGNVSGLASSPLGVLIFTSNSQTYLLGGTDKFDFTLSALAKSIGCIDYKSINNLKNTAIWLDYEGLMMSVGSTVSNISKEKVNLDGIGNIITSLVYDNVYYLIGTNYSLFVDFRYNMPSFKKVSGVGFITVHEGKLYVDISGQHYEDFTKTGDYMTMTYKAPMFIGNSYDILTEFDKINLTYKGDFTYTIYIDEVEVLTDTISSASVKVEEIKIPSETHEGLGIELKLQGTGEIKAFRYIFSNVNIN